MERLLYKYSSINMNLISSLAGGYLFFSKPDNFNDPFDSNLNYLLDKRILWSSGNRDIENAITDLKGRMGICCLTSDDENLHMWAHYGNSHRGICVGYDVELIEKYLQKNHINILAKKVNYVAVPLIYSNHGFYGYDENGNNHFYKANPNVKWDYKYLDKATENLILQKNALIWKNEQEHRMIASPLAISTGLEKKLISIEEKGFKLTLPPDAIKKIYFGAKTSKEDIELVAKVLEPNVETKKLEISSMGWKVE